MSHLKKKDLSPDANIPGFTGKVIVVTGGNTGIGKEVCLALVKHHPAKIIILARNSTSGQSTINEIRTASSDVDGAFIECDLASFKSINNAPQHIALSTARLDLLFCNAGILGAPAGLTVDGYEIHFGVNHLGHALLIKRLLPLLLKTADLYGDVRVITNSSDGCRFHASQGIVFKDLRTTQENLTYMGMLGGWLRYFQSKLANIIYNVELAQRYPQITFVAIHPGIVDTEPTSKWIKSTALMRQLMAGGELKTPAEGAWNQLWAATARGVRSGEYYEPVGIVGKRTKISQDKKLSAELWNWTEVQVKDW